MEKIYRYTTSGKGVFYMGRKLLPAELIGDIDKIKGSIPNPELPDGDYEFWLKKKGKDTYLRFYKPIHDKYLKDIVEESRERIDDKKVIYEDEYQVVYKSDNSINDPLNPYRKR